MVFGPALALAGATCAAGSLALARRAENRALPSADSPVPDSELFEDETHELLGRSD